jgi:hypothetical protein
MRCLFLFPKAALVRWPVMAGRRLIRGVVGRWGMDGGMVCVE